MTVGPQAARLRGPGVRGQGLVMSPWLDAKGARMLISNGSEEKCILTCEWG